MPKIINGVKDRILKEAKRQILEGGYEAMTIRSVVCECGISTGTLYNYFSSKDELIASFLLQDWMLYVEKMKSACATMNDVMSVFEIVYNSIMEFSEQYSMIFSDSTAKEKVSSGFYSRHVMLRMQISEIINELCKRYANHYTEFLPDFIAETLIIWSVEKHNFDDVKQILNSLF